MYSYYTETAVTGSLKTDPSESSNYFKFAKFVKVNIKT